MEFFDKVFGVNNMRMFFASVGLVAIFYLFFNLIKKKSGFLKIAVNLLVIILAVMYWQGFDIFEERTHLLQYGLIGYLAIKDFQKANKPIRAIIFAAVFILLVGSLDEIFQRFIPWRVGDIRDVFADLISGIFGVILYILR